MHRGLIGRVLVALAVLLVGVAIIAKAPIGTGTKPKAKGVAIIAKAPIKPAQNQSHSVVALP
jgi:hypothetical protein